MNPFSDTSRLHYYLQLHQETSMEKRSLDLVPKHSPKDIDREQGDNERGPQRKKRH